MCFITFKAKSEINSKRIYSELVGRRAEEEEHRLVQFRNSMFIVVEEPVNDNRAKQLHYSAWMFTETDLNACWSIMSAS